MTFEIEWIMPRFFHVVCIQIDNTRQTSWKRFQSPTLVRFNGWWQDPAQALKTRLTARVNVTSCRSPVVSCLIICCTVSIHNIQYYHTVHIYSCHGTIRYYTWPILGFAAIIVCVCPSGGVPSRLNHWDPSGLGWNSVRMSFCYHISTMYQNRQANTVRWSRTYPM